MYFFILYYFLRNIVAELYDQIVVISKGEKTLWHSNTKVEGKVKKCKMKMKDEGSHNQSLAPSFASFSLLLISKLPSSSFLISGNSYRYWNAQKEHKLHLLQAISYNIEELLAFLFDYLLWNEQVSQTLSHLRLPRYFSRFLCFFAHWRCMISQVLKMRMICSECWWTKDVWFLQTSPKCYSCFGLLVFNNSKHSRSWGIINLVQTQPSPLQEKNIY